MLPHSSTICPALTTSPVSNATIMPVLIEEVHAYLLRAENVHHIVNAVSGPKPRVARIASQMCMTHLLLPQHDLLVLSLASADMLTRLSVLPLLHQSDMADRLPLLATALANSCMPLRRAAFMVYCKEQPVESTGIAQSLLFDRSATVRELALNVLVKRGVSVSALLRPILEQSSAPPDRLRHAIWGLAQLGQLDALPRLKDFVSDFHPSVRRAAVLALAKLDSANAAGYLLAGLRDASPVVHKGLTRQIIRSGVDISVDDVGALLHENLPHLCHAALTLAPETGKWEWLLLLLEAVQLPPGLISQQEMANELAHWDQAFNLSYLQPTSQQISRIRREVEQCGSRLGQGYRELIEFSLPGLQR